MVGTIRPRHVGANNTLRQNRFSHRTILDWYSLLPAAIENSLGKWHPARDTLLLSAFLPTTNATSRRVYHQMQVWQGNSMEAPEWGWEQCQKRQILKPQRMDKVAAPASILKLICCNCRLLAVVENIHALAKKNTEYSACGRAKAQLV